MKCEKYFDAIDDLVEGELDGRTAGEVNLHIFACPQCASRYATLAREKKMYAQYLFEVEPESDLPIKFRTRLQSESNNPARISRILTDVFGWKTDIAGFLRLHPASVGAVVLIVFGIGLGLLKFMPEETTRTEKKSAAETESGSVQFPTAKPAEIDKNAVTDLRANANGGDDFISLKSVKKTGENRLPNAKSTVGLKVKFDRIKPAKIKKQSNPANENEDLTADAQLLKERQTRRLQLSSLEKETAGQIEKIELLFRSFRNARMTESGDAFDVSYEKQQAQKLLKKNAQLRRTAENYGTLYTEEILSQVEPYLLDISNLEVDSSPAKVLDIKERVKNQNIIARLQAYY